MLFLDLTILSFVLKPPGKSLHSTGASPLQTLACCSDFCAFSNLVLTVPPKPTPHTSHRLRRNRTNTTGRDGLMEHCALSPDEKCQMPRNDCCRKLKTRDLRPPSLLRHPALSHPAFRLAWPEAKTAPCTAPLAQPRPPGELLACSRTAPGLQARTRAPHGSRAGATRVCTKRRALPSCSHDPMDGQDLTQAEERFLDMSAQLKEREEICSAYQ